MSSPARSRIEPQRRIPSCTGRGPITVARARSRRLCERHPAGAIFRNQDGNPWTLQAINCRFKRKRNRKNDKLDKGITAYVYRPSWATDALENGVPDASVAELMGHSNTAMLHKHYSKLRENREHLRKAAEQATKKAGD